MCGRILLPARFDEFFGKILSAGRLLSRRLKYADTLPRRHMELGEQRDIVRDLCEMPKWHGIFRRGRLGARDLRRLRAQDLRRRGSIRVHFLHSWPLLPGRHVPHTMRSRLLCGRRGARVLFIVSPGFDRGIDWIDCL